MHRMIVLVLFCMFAFGGCGKPVAEPAAIAIKSVTLLERLTVEIPADWKLVRNTIGTVQVSIYQIPYSGTGESPTVFLKCQSCDPQLEVDMYRRYQLRDKDFSEGSGNVIISEDFEGDNWQRVKWVGDSIGGEYIIWDIFGVENELAMHFRATSPAKADIEELTDRLDREMELVFNSIKVEPVLAEQASARDIDND